MLQIVTNFLQEANMIIGKRLQHAAFTALTALLFAAPAAQAQQRAERAPCGFAKVTPQYNNGAAAIYTHCADSFILIRVDRSGQKATNRCMEPWGTTPFWPYEKVDNAYYIPVPPRVVDMETWSFCSLTQPEA